MIDVSSSGHYVGDCRALLAQLPAACVQTCITSPPYWGLRDYGVDGQLGLEATPEEYIVNMVEVFEGVWRVLKDDGTLWLNIGDCYAQGGRGSVGNKGTLEGGRHSHAEARAARDKLPTGRQVPPGLKPKDLVGIPWMLAFALRARGWYLRADIIWSKPAPLPESVRDRPTKSHEYLFLLSKSERYYYDIDAIREPVTGNAHDRGAGVNPKALAAAPGSRQNPSWSAAITKAYKSGNKARKHRDEHGGAQDTGAHQAFGVPWEDEDGLRNKRSVWSGDDEGPLRALAYQALKDGDGDLALQVLEHLATNKRSVWTVATQPYSGAHFATFPPKLIEPCVLAGSRVGDLVLDPFFGSGTTGEVAEKHGRRWVGFDISAEYAQLAKERTAQRSLMAALEGK